MYFALNDEGALGCIFEITQALILQKGSFYIQDVSHTKTVYSRNERDIFRESDVVVFDEIESYRNQELPYYLCFKHDNSRQIILFEL